jgi:hypothetical protein
MSYFVRYNSVWTLAEIPKKLIVNIGVVLCKANMLNLGIFTFN